MSLESEFEEHWGGFHENLNKAVALFLLYPEYRRRKYVAAAEKSVPAVNDHFIALLKIDDERVLRVFQEWKTPDKTADLLEEIEAEQPGGHLTADLTWTFWKYADVVRAHRGLHEQTRQKALLEQSIVASCTAYEHFLKVMIPWILKNQPDSAKRYLGRVNRPLKDFGKFAFDVAGNVDKIFRRDYDKSLFPVFPDVVNFYERILRIHLFRSKTERAYVNKIFEVRHCIVHTGGKPDRKWKRKMKGARFVVDRRTSWRYVRRLHNKLHDAGVLIYKSLELDLKKAPFRRDMALDKFERAPWEFPPLKEESHK